MWSFTKDEALYLLAYGYAYASMPMPMANLFCVINSAILCQKTVFGVGIRFSLEITWKLIFKTTRR